MAKTADPALALSEAISLRHIRFFVALAQIGHFGRAAERVGVTQPALSAAIRQIEAQLGIRLFERTTHRVALATAGSALLPHAQRLLTTAENAFADMREAARQVATTVRIGVVPSVVASLAELLAEQDPEPAISIHLHDGKSDELIAGLRAGAYDCVVSVATTVDPGFEAIPVVEDEMLALVRADHPRIRGGPLSWRALAAEEIVRFSGGGIGELTAAALEQNGLSPSSRYRVDQVDSLYGLVVAGLAVGVMPGLYTRALDSSSLQMIPLVRPSVRRPIRMLFRSQLKHEHPVAHAFCRTLTERLRRKLMPPPE